MAPVELTRKGINAFVNALGYVDAVKFIRQFARGSGDYTQEHLFCCMSCRSIPNPLSLG
ncbi:hypothetical protein [Gloeothece verrucosa]|uniref:Uncharacterized protein n=1 Tax=Gloeothece verrucosa (strain PCC 7822) TaxID=497965 RepID=E0UFJ6_GLOV7|nr:hypothetical protein [Gloeothece verrucosa]ADN16690.1 hypothetical protein Cyan7822_4792 [Gloeothece verrucosa PCC 7822]